MQFDWDEPAERSVSFEVDQNRARQLNVSSQDVANYLAMTLSGYTVTQFRERDKLISVDLRAPKRERVDPSQIEQPGGSDAERPGAAGFPRTLQDRLEYGVIWERDRQPTITVQADVQGNAQGIDVTTRYRASTCRAAQARLPVGYRIEIGGAVEESVKGQTSINARDAAA